MRAEMKFRQVSTSALLNKRQKMTSLGICLLSLLSLFSTSSLAVGPADSIESETAYTFQVSKVKMGNVSHLQTQPTQTYLRQIFLDDDWQRMVQNGCSHDDDSRVVDGDTGIKHGFISSAILAFDKHLPLLIRPQHLWLMITQAIAVHVGRNGELLRDRFVRHEGRKALIVKVDDPMLFEFSKEDWESIVLSFEKQIREETVDGVVDNLSASSFSSTNLSEGIASTMVVMDTCKSFF